jgi:hypothetical protein
MKNKSVTFRLKRELYDFIKIQANENFTSISYILTKYILEKYTEKKSGTNKKMSNL